MPAGRRWEAWEDEILRKYYPYEDFDLAALKALLPDDRSISKIQDRASRLHLRRINCLNRDNHIEEQPILKSFYKYIARAKAVALEHRITPDVEEMMKTFRQVYSDELFGAR